MNANVPPLEPITQEDQYILTQVGNHRVAFAANWVGGILLSERSQVLVLPFYQEPILGIVHHQGQLVPLVMLQQLLDDTPVQMREVFNAIQLSERTDTPGLGLVIDRLLGNCSDEDVAADETIERFQPHLLEPDLWEPSRWAALRT